MKLIERLREEIPCYSFEEITVLHPETRKAYKRIIINNVATNIVYDLEKQLEMIEVFGIEYNEILCERIKKQVNDFISKRS